jgi:hypothetical protein
MCSVECSFPQNTIIQRQSLGTDKPFPPVDIECYAPLTRLLYRLNLGNTGGALASIRSLWRPWQAEDEGCPR